VVDQVSNPYERIRKMAERKCRLTSFENEPRICKIWNCVIPAGMVQRALRYIVVSQHSESTRLVTVAECECLFTYDFSQTRGIVDRRRKAIFKIRTLYTGNDMALWFATILSFQYAIFLMITSYSMLVHHHTSVVIAVYT
jgi:hypothetical protein